MVGEDAHVRPRTTDERGEREAIERSVRVVGSDDDRPGWRQKSHVLGSPHDADAERHEDSLVERCRPPIHSCFLVDAATGVEL